MKVLLEIGLPTREYVRNVSLRSIYTSNGETCLFRIVEDAYSLIGNDDVPQLLKQTVELDGVIAASGFKEWTGDGTLHAQIVLEPCVSPLFITLKTEEIL